MRPIRLGAGFLTVGSWTLLSRILGFARDILIAGLLGAGPVAEAFLIAFSLPNMFRRFFAEGAFNMAFVPMFSKKLQANDGALEFARDAFAGLAGVLIVFTLIAQIFMPWLVLAMAGGFAGDGRLDLATDYARIGFIYILFISLAALLSGVLNALGRFTAAAAAPVLLNVLFIAAMALALLAGWPVGDALAWAVPFAGMAQLALVWIAASRAGYRLRPRLPRMTPELKRLAIIAAPAAFAGGVVQVNLLVGRQVASFFDGAIAWLNYADRLYQLPLGVVGIAIGVVLLPDLSRRLQADDAAGAQNALSRAGEISLILTLPAAAALIAIPGPLIGTLFQRGAFTATDTAATALAVAIYGAGLPAFVMQKVLLPLFFAREDTRRPFYYALVALVVNAALAIGLAPFIGYLAAAIGTSLAGWATVALLWRGARGMGSAAKFDARFWTRIAKALIASWMMAVVLRLALSALQPLFDQGAWRYLALALLVAVGMAAYGVFGQIIGAFHLRDLKSQLRRS